METDARPSGHVRQFDSSQYEFIRQAVDKLEADDPEVTNDGEEYGEFVTRPNSDEPIEHVVLSVRIREGSHVAYLKAQPNIDLATLPSTYQREDSLIMPARATLVSTDGYSPEQFEALGDRIQGYIDLFKHQSEDTPSE